MALIPGTLPSDTCYGTPQDLLELFAQYLDVPAFALNSKVVFSSANPASLTADVVWFDTGFAAPASAANPIMKITTSSGGFVDYVNNYATNLAVVTTPASGDYLLISQSNVLKKITYSNITPTPANDSITYPMLNNGATEANNAAKRTVKAWVNFNGSVPSIYSTQSFNISSITRSATGTFTINFTTAMAAANYAVIGTVGTGTENYTNVAAACVRLFAATTTNFTIVTVLQNSNGFDFGYTCVAVLSS